MRRGVTRILGFSFLVAMLIALWRAWSVRARAAAGEQEWVNAPFPFPPVPRPARRHVVVPPDVELGGGPETEAAGEVAVESIEPWVAPIDGGCPPSHPIKAKLSSGIYHSPGGMNYERTKPDRCYLDAAAAERDGLRAAKR